MHNIFDECLRISDHWDSGWKRERPCACTENMAILVSPSAAVVVVPRDYGMLYPSIMCPVMISWEPVNCKDSGGG